jgi:hypothetical protein
MLMSGDGHRL